MMRLELDIVATRGEMVESHHHVHAAVVDGKGALRASAGDPACATVLRSCAKPFQALPFVASGGFDALGWNDEMLALACASHGGEPEHIAIVSRMLASMGLEEGDLACGPHEPLTRRGQKALKEAGENPTRLHNNCSGKHAAMLGFAKTQGWPMRGYEQCVHPVQRAVIDCLAEWTGVPASQLRLLTDGCGVVAFGLPLQAFALGFARLAVAAQQGDAHPARVLGAMRAHPFLVGGTDRFDTVLMEETEGRVISKIGAEGVHAVAVPERGIAAVVKVEDGAFRAQHPAVVRLLQYLEVLPEELPPRLAAFLRTPIVNTRGAVVGEIRPVA
jgi:L-asparaginase II